MKYLIQFSKIEYHFNLFSIIRLKQIWKIIFDILIFQVLGMLTHHRRAPDGALPPVGAFAIGFPRRPGPGPGPGPDAVAPGAPPSGPSPEVPAKGAKPKSAEAPKGPFGAF